MKEEHRLKLKKFAGRKPKQVVIGYKYGRLKIIKELPRYIVPNGRPMRIVECKCDCGSIKKYFLHNIKKNQSCGCLQKEVIGNYSRNRIYPKGKDSHAWKGGITDRKYSIDWTETLRQSIRERDNLSCKLCGKHQGDYALSVHHIDYNKLNCSPTNLITLCSSCHQKTNFNKQKWINYFKDYLIIN